MAHIAFVLTNDRHHHDLLFPVAKRLATRHRVRLISFCEFRGARTPSEDWSAIRAEVTRVPPFKARPSAVPADALVTTIEKIGVGRTMLQTLLWRMLLSPFLRLEGLDLAVLCNDAAFPVNRLVDALNNRRVPFLLLPEGIRFPLPREGSVAFGTRGASAIACWGEASAEYFESLGINRERIKVTGCPRYDEIHITAQQRASDKAKHDGLLPVRYVLFASNPIDHQGFCSTKEKLDAWTVFVSRWIPALASQGSMLAVKVHPGELQSDFANVLSPEMAAKVFFVPPSLPLGTAIAGSEGVIVWASTVGIEALLQNKPLAVLPVPGHGFVFDYVSSGVAEPITFNEDANQILARMSKSCGDVQDYLERRIAWRGEAALRVTELCESLLCESKLPGKQMIGRNDESAAKMQGVGGGKQS